MARVRHFPRRFKMVRIARIVGVCFMCGLFMAPSSLFSQEPEPICPPANSSSILEISFSFQMLAKPDIPQEDLIFLSNELVKVVCDTLCNGTNCGVKANTTSIEGLMSTPFYVTIIEIPSQTKENIKLLKEKCKSVVKQYDKLHKSRLSWSIDIEKKKDQPNKK
jgi:hypothetical protein